MLNKIETIEEHDEYLAIYINTNDTSLLSMRVSKFWVGLVWPEYPIHPAYYCIFGEMWRESGKRGKLVFVSEGESSDMYLAPMLDEMTDVLYFLKSYDIYTDIKNEQFVAEFRDYTVGNDLRFDLRNAPFTGNFNLGINSIDRIRKVPGIDFGNDRCKLKMEYETLSKEKINNLKNDDIQSEIYPIHALRYIATSFEKYGNSAIDINIKIAMNKFKGVLK